MALSDYKVTSQDSRYKRVQNIEGDTLTGTVSENKKVFDDYPDYIAEQHNNLIDNITYSDVGAVPTTRTVNGKALSSNISLSASDVGAVATVSGKGLSTNDYTTTEKNKLAGIATNANNYTHPSYTAKTSGLYKITVDSTGHVSATEFVPATKAFTQTYGSREINANTNSVLGSMTLEANKKYIITMRASFEEGGNYVGISITGSSGTELAGVTTPTLSTSSRSTKLETTYYHSANFDVIIQFRAISHQEAYVTTSVSYMVIGY